MYPAGTRFDYAVSWSNSSLGEIYQAGVITSGQVAQWVSNKIAENGSDLILESSSGGSYLAIFKGGNNAVLSFRTLAPFDSQADMQAVADALVINGLGSYGDLTYSSIQSVTVPGGSPQGTGAPKPGDTTNPVTQKSLWDLIFGSQNTSTKVIEAIAALVVVVILLIYFFPAQGVSAARTIRS